MSSSSSSSSSLSSTTTASCTLPPTLTSDPISALVPPGQCQFGPEPIAVPLLERTAVSPTSYVLRFGLPNRQQPLNLSTCACLLARAKLASSSADEGDADEEEEVVTRPYTPISTNQDVGSFSLLVKSYGPAGRMSTFLCEQLKVTSDEETETSNEQQVSFLHIPFNVKTQAPFDEKYHRICMLVGGSGITPMIQALHAILGRKSDHNGKKRPVVTLLYGSRTSNDILGYELLQKWAMQYPEQLRVVHVLSNEPDDSTWQGARGFITKELIQEHFPTTTTTTTDDKFQFWICGPPGMYNALSGPRDEPDTVHGVLAELGYSAEQVYKF